MTAASSPAPLCNCPPPEIGGAPAPDCPIHGSPEDSGTAAKIARLSAWIESGPTYQGLDAETVVWRRIGKIAEEYGEVIAAWIGVTGEDWQRRQRELDIEDIIGEPIPAPTPPDGMAEIRFLNGPYAGHVQYWAHWIAGPARFHGGPEAWVEYDVRPWSLHPNRAYAFLQSATAQHGDSAYLTAQSLISDEAVVRSNVDLWARMVRDLRRHLTRHCVANGQESYPNTFEVQAVRDDLRTETRITGRIQTRPTGSATVAQAPQPFQMSRVWPT